MKLHLLGSLALLLTCSFVGCTSTTTSNTARTGTEQLLVSNAIDQSLNRVDFSPFTGQKVFLQEKYLECVDKNYVIASIRHRLLKTQAELVADAASADIVLEPRSGGVGTHSADMFLGVPEIVLPGMLTLPETRLVEKKNQKGVAKIGLVAYDAKTNRALGTGGSALSESQNSNWFVLGVGPYQNGSMQDELKESRRRGTVKSRSVIPQSVSFSAPQSSPSNPANTVRLASEEQPQPPAAPATQPGDAPAWAK